MPLTVLSVAFPFAPVSEDPVGGAEQVLSHLDRALVRAGARSIVVASEGSTPAGDLVPVRQPTGDIGASEQAETHAQVRRLITEAVGRHHPDLVHMHGVDFWAYEPPPGPPVLVTLHLPLSWYPAEALTPIRADTWLAPVSHDQARRGPATARLTEPIENGVDLGAYPPARKHRFAVALGRICPEKGFHHALDAARAAGVPLLLAGSVFPYAEHRRYFEAEIAPRLDRARRWIGPVTGPAKRRLMAAGLCLVAPSLAPETSSLVAREALAAGTPVVALRTGALEEVVEDGRTGVLVDRPEALPQAIADAGRLRPEDCRRAAASRFGAGRMVASYMSVYRRLSAGESLPLMQGWGADA
ncbi:MAG: hypothetical protein JWQ46_1804 [Phenylobacterium sp.]|jgi:glycosyltransferase involved in cell wall biosynthesis|nr:hypothetical protein [Phenylobacterium sp.]